MHLLGSLAFLGLIVLLLLAYCMAPLLLFRLGRWLLIRIRTDEGRWKDCFRWPLSKKEVRIFGFVLLVLALFNGSFYLRQRGEWMGDDNAHLTAKNYYVAGQVLYLYRSIATDFLHPDNFILGPMNGLQKWIYSTGVQYLPEEDGEAGVWMHTWFVYPYSKRFRIPKGYFKYIKEKKVAPMVVAHLDRAWFSIEQLATKPLADKQMQQQHYLRDFPGMAHYYAFYEGFYTGNNSGSDQRISKMPEHVERSEKLVDWLLAFKERASQSEEAQVFLQEHALIEQMRLVTLLMELHDILHGRAVSGQFRCDDPMWVTFQNVRQEYVNDKTGGHKKISGKNDQVKKLGFVAINSWPARFDYYVLDRHCGIQLAGTPDWEDAKRTQRARNITLDEAIDYRVKNIFTEAYEKLEGLNRGN